MESKTYIENLFKKKKGGGEGKLFFLKKRT